MKTTFVIIYLTIILVAIKIIIAKILFYLYSLHKDKFNMFHK